MGIYGERYVSQQLSFSVENTMTASLFWSFRALTTGVSVWFDLQRCGMGMWVPCLTPIYSWFEGYLPTSCPSHGGFQMTPVMFRLFFFSEDPWHCGSLLLKPSWQRTWAVFGPHRKTSPGFWDLISHTLLNTFTWYTLIYCNILSFW